MTARPIIYLSALAFATLTSCAGLNTRLPVINAEALEIEIEQQEFEALKHQKTETDRLLNVGWRILSENANLCPKTRISLGLRTHSLDTYPKQMRDSAATALAADDSPRVLHVIDDSPAALAGIKTGDIILGDDGEPAKFKSKIWKDSLSDNLVDVKRGEEVLSLPITPSTVCDYSIQLSNTSVINAYANGRKITVTTGMLNFVESDDELALIIGHELAHNTMAHIPKTIGNYIVSFGGTRYTRPFESEADYVGMYYLVRAGYSPEGVEKFWQRLAKISPKSINLAKTHPTFPDRYLRLQAARDEINEKKAANLPLLPNFKTKSNVELDSNQDTGSESSKNLSSGLEASN